LFWCYL
jgi:hypothetical protein